MPTNGRNENRTSVTTLLPEEPKCVVTPDFTLDHYNISSLVANFDTNPDHETGGSRGFAQTSYEIEGAGEDMNNGDTFFLQDTIGNVATFEIDTGSTTVDGSVNIRRNVIVGVNSCADEAAVCARFVAAIRNCQSTLYIVSEINPEDDTQGWLTQKIPGAAGNGPKAESMGNVVGVDDTPAPFTDGELYEDIQAPFSKRFQLIRTPVRSGSSMERNDKKSEG